MNKNILKMFTCVETTFFITTLYLEHFNLKSVRQKTDSRTWYGFNSVTLTVMLYLKHEI